MLQSDSGGCCGTDLTHVQESPDYVQTFPPFVLDGVIHSIILVRKLYPLLQLDTLSLSSKAI